MLDAALDAELEVLSVQRAVFGMSVQTPFCFTVTGVDSDAPLRGCVYTDDPDWLSEKLCAVSPAAPRRKPDVQLELAVRAADFLIAPDEMAALGIGDLLVFEQDWTEADSMDVIIAGALKAQVRPERKGFKIISRPRWMPPLDPDKPKERALKDTGKSTMLDGLDVTLSIEMDRLTAPVSEVEKYVAGTVIPLGTATPEKVKVIANGADFAEAELVSIGEGVGLQILKLL
jgi:flagellar motor switch/type III secretory pathway protein FliN